MTERMAMVPMKEITNDQQGLDVPRHVLIVVE